MKFFIACVFVLILAFPALSQTDSTQKFTFSGYVEPYYQYDFSQPGNHTRPGFVYSHNRTQEFAINLGLIRGSYQDNRVRANLALAAGTYMNANYSAEPGVLKNLYEANVGVKISSQKDLWVDAGIFGAHIGYESAVGKDNWTLTRSMTADNTPYYLTGVKLTYNTPNEKWLLSGLLLNGWQQIQRSDNNNRIAVGTQIQFKPIEGFTINSSTFFGAAPDSTNRNRYFHNLYAIWQVTDKLGLTAAFDYGVQQVQSGSANYDNWKSMSALLRYQLAEKWWLTGRFEKYMDRKGTIISSNTPNGFNTDNYTLNLDFAPFKNVLWRLEGRVFNSQDAIFSDSAGKAQRSNAVVSTALAVSF